MPRMKDPNSRMKAASTKLQTPKKSQISSSPAARQCVLGIGAWDFSGAWCLGFGVLPIRRPRRPRRLTSHLGRIESWKTCSLRFELGFLAALIVLLNLPLLHGGCAASLIFEPDRVAAGEWWRLFSHPFVHVSWYHLVLDAAAFLLLYRELDGTKWFERAGYLLASGAGSLLVSLWAAPLVQTHGLCGLSGIAHGLMSVSALGMMQNANDKTVKRAGMVTFIIVITKSIVEAATG